MMKFPLTQLFFLVFLLVSCTSVKSQMRKKPSTQMNQLTESLKLKDSEIFEKVPKNGEYTHEMAEADADDDKIKRQVGLDDIDRELPGSEEERGIPYSKSFLTLKKTKRMEFWIEYFTQKNRERFQRFINNGEEYRHIIEKVFEQYGLPKELYFVGLIESGYYLGARSHASAVGPWQFIKGTGKRYGLKISTEVDERQDLFKASHAAAKYFKDLHNVFSSWELALAAYNAGEYGIIRRIMKHGTRDFYELSKNKKLPSETINYIPKVLAAMHVVNNAEKYGLIIPRKKPRLFDLTELVPVKKNVPLKKIADRLDISPKLLKKLNPELKTAHTPKYFTGPYMLRIPTSKYSYMLPDEANQKEVALKKPESKKELNRRTASTGQDEVNTNINSQIKRSKAFSTFAKNGQKKIALNRLNSKFEKSKIKITNRPVVYQVRRGDNLTDLARLFDTKVSKIKKVNRMKKSHVLVGQKIILPDTKQGIYTVKKGDVLKVVAKKLNRPIETLVKLNSLKKGTLYAGQKLIVNMD
jgi:membrane-bound lytic murein transglycosylase D